MASQVLQRWLASRQGAVNRRPDFVPLPGPWPRGRYLLVPHCFTATLGRCGNRIAVSDHEDS